MQRSVKQRERGALAGTRQRRALSQLPPSLDIVRRQRAERARHLGERQLGEVVRFERVDPAVELFVGRIQMIRRGRSAAPGDGPTGRRGKTTWEDAFRGG